MVPSMGGMGKTVELFGLALKTDVVSFTDGPMLDQEGSAVEGVEHIRIDPGWLGRFYSWAPASARLKADSLAEHANLIACHTMFRYHVHWARTWVRKKQIPYWVVPHGCLDPYVFSYRAWQKKPWMRLIGRRHLREAAAVIFASRREMEKAAPHLSRDNGRVIHWPVTDRVLPPQVRTEARANWRKELGANDADRLLVFLGRMHSMKRPVETMKCFSEASTTRSHLVIAGPDGDHSRSDLEALARGNPKIHFLEPVWGDRKATLLAAADGYISLSHRENFGFSGAESLKVGLPVILSPGNDLAGELGSVGCGWLLPDLSDRAAIAAIRAFDRASDDDLATMGASGRAWAERELSFEKFASSLRSLAEETLSAKR